MQFYYTYVLLSLRDGKFYIGFSTDLAQRVKDHQRGNNASTAKRLPLILIFYEAFLSKHDALRREAYFKTNKGKTTLKQMLRDYIATRK